MVLLAIVAVGLPTALRRPAAVPLLVLAAVAVVLPAVMATGPGWRPWRRWCGPCPASACCATAQKWVALAVPGYALAGAARGRHAAAADTGRGDRARCAALALIAVLPDLAWGVGGKVTPVRYPAGWSAVAAMINADPRPVAVLPPDSMRDFAWAGDAPVLDPLPRWVSADVLSTGDLVIGGQTVPGEGERAREVQRLLLSGAERRRVGRRRAWAGWSSNQPVRARAAATLLATD